ncbi:hypothetical protein [Chitinivorax sp. B]|uniref:hypothetical protein n=1 Tax=Chitinivorax sp. B TaxID=2502235 RepID=UPI0010F7A8E7|nr:hypothetical protein [Chitinivorax sp. B]
MKPLRFDQTIPYLEQRRTQIIALLKADGSDATLIAEKDEIEQAMATLRFCAQWQLSAHSNVIELPFTQNGYAGYGVVELDEMGNMLRPVAVDGEMLELMPHALLVTRPGHLAKYYINDESSD